MDKRFEYGSATAMLSEIDDHVYLLSSVFARERGKGHATRLMQDIVDYVDEHEGVIFLTAQQYGHPTDGLNNRELLKFYSKFGFARDDRYPKPPFRMIRYFRGE